MTSAPITYGSVCSGIEAPGSAWHPLGWKPLWFSEIEPFPKAVLAHHYPTVPDLGDMTTLPARILAGEVPAPDVFVGGTPCQSFSVAGLRKGLADPRGQLTRTFVEIIDALDTVRLTAGKPPVVTLYENVPGILSDKDNAFGNFLGALAGEDDALLPPGGRWSNCGCVLGPQRTVAWRVLDAQYFGVAQRRRRVFAVISARSSAVDPVEVLLVEQGMRRDTPPSREAWQGAPAPAARSADAGGEGRGDGTGSDGGRGGGVDAIGFEPRYYTRDNKTGGGPSSTVSITAGGASKFGDAAPCVAHVVAPPLTATNDPSRSPQSAEVTAQVEAVLRAQYPEVIGSLDTECGGGKLTHQSAKNGHLLPVVPYDLFQITAPINRQSRDERSPCHTLAKDNAAHAAVVTTQATHFDVYNHKTTGDVTGVLREQHGTNMNAVLQPSMAVRRLTPTLSFKAGQSEAAGSTFVTEEFAPTLQAQNNGSTATPAVLHQMLVRRLTPTECERLQGFPDGWTQIPWKGKPASECPDGPRYRALGNSMAVPVIRWIGRKIEERIAAAEAAR